MVEQFLLRVRSGGVQLSMSICLSANHLLRQKISSTVFLSENVYGCGSGEVAAWCGSDGLSYGRRGGQQHKSKSSRYCEQQEKPLILQLSLNPSPKTYKTLFISISPSSWRRISACSSENFS